MINLIIEILVLAFVGLPLTIITTLQAHPIKATMFVLGALVIGTVVKTIKEC